MTELLRLEGVFRVFDTVRAVDGVDLAIAAEAFFSLLGPSGCGKTTLLRIMAGFERPDSGRVLLDGKDITDLPPQERPVNLMFQSYALFPHLSVFDNVAYGPRRAGMAGAALRDRVSEALALVQLADLAPRRPDQLSGGQRQRVALARALARRPRLLLLDEPLSALDQRLREETMFELINLRERVGITFVTVTHDQEEAMTVSDRMAVMDRGRIVQEGPPSQLYEYPVNRFVADFLGDVSLFEGTVLERDGSLLRLGCPGAGGKVEGRVEGAAPPPGATGWIAVRPEKIRLTRERPNLPPSAANCFRGTVSDIAYSGRLTTYVVRLDSGLMVRATDTNRVRRADLPFTWGDAAWVAFDAEAAVGLAA